MKIEKLYRRCPVCAGREVQYIYNVPFVLFDNHPMSDGYNLVQCKNCLFVYADVRVTQQQLDIYYKDLSKYEDKKIGTGGGYNKNDRDRLAETARFISFQFPEKNARIIDLGCANGGLLKELKTVGYTNLVGLDPSAKCVEVTRREVGCEAYQMSLFDIDEKLGRFDLVILSHVLEHLLDLSTTINKLHILLKDHSFVYVECPNASNYHKVIHAPFQEFNTEHINHFTEVSFENLLGLHSFQKKVTGNKVMKIASEQDYHAVYGLFEKLPVLSDYQIKPDLKINKSISAYIHKSEKVLAAILKTIDELNPSEPIALYGIGQFAFKLLYLLKDRTKNMKLFDNNSLNIKKKINGVEVLPGNSIVEEYVKAPFAILIATLIHEKSIRKEIEEQFSAKSIHSPSIISFGNYLINEYVSE